MDLALFDFDHTITFADTYSRFLRVTADPAKRRRGEWSLAPWLAGYRLGVVSAKGIRARATRVAFEGRPLREVREQGARYAREILPGLLRPEMMDRIAWHKSRGDTVAVVSGSLDVYLRPWCEAHGLALICNELESKGSVLTGRYHPCDRAAEKARHINERYELAAYAAIHAYGDSREDQQMLALASHRWFRGRQVA
ncbi:MAG: HAD family hydrolase [Proteobacteria bacterium]|nr:MAG: HAD family hydrolase [Pseudomonadota bacterium]